MRGVQGGGQSLSASRCRPIQAAAGPDRFSKGVAGKKTDEGLIDIPSKTSAPVPKVTQINYRSSRQWGNEITYCRMANRSPGRRPVYLTLGFMEISARDWLTARGRGVVMQAFVIGGDEDRVLRAPLAVADGLMRLPTP